MTAKNNQFNNQFNNQKQNKMEESLTILKEYALSSDNLWLAGKLDSLKTQIQIEILKAELDILNKF